MCLSDKNHDASVGGWGHDLPDLCYDARLFILSGHTPGDELRDSICLANGGRTIIDYIVDSPVVWQVATQFKVIIDDTYYCAMGGDSNHMPLHLRLNIDCSFVEPQHMVETKKFILRFEYDKSKVEEY